MKVQNHTPAKYLSTSLVLTTPRRVLKDLAGLLEAVILSDEAHWKDGHFFVEKMPSNFSNKVRVVRRSNGFLVLTPP